MAEPERAGSRSGWKQRERLGRIMFRNPFWMENYVNVLESIEINYYAFDEKAVVTDNCSHWINEEYYMIWFGAKLNEITFENQLVFHFASA